MMQIITLHKVFPFAAIVVPVRMKLALLIKAAKTITALHGPSIVETAGFVLSHRARRRPFGEILIPSRKKGAVAKAV